MATQQTTDTHEFTGGEIVEFVAYETELGAGEEALLSKGDRLKVQKVNDDGGLVCIVVDENDKDVQGRQGDTLFPEEVKLLTTEPKKATARTRTKAAAKPAAEPVAAKDTKAAEPQTGTKTTEKAKAKAASKAKAKTAKVGDNSKPVSEQPKVVIAHAAEVLALINEKGAIEAVKALSDNVEQTYFNMGGLLYEINEQGLHEHHGFEGTKGFHDFVEIELGIAYQKAKNLMEIYEVFQDPRVLKKLTASRLKKLGWSKAKQLARLGADQLVEAWDDVFAVATEKTRDELTAHIKSKYVVATRTSDKVKSTKFSFTLVGDAAATIIRALDQAKQLVGDDDGNKAFEYICGEWLNLTEGVEVNRGPTFEDVDALIGYAEEQFGATLTQVDTEEEEG